MGEWREDGASGTNQLNNSRKGRKGGGGEVERSSEEKEGERAGERQKHQHSEGEDEIKRQEGTERDTRTQNESSSYYGKQRKWPRRLNLNETPTQKK